MDFNDRARSGRSNQRAGGTSANRIRGPHSALTDYLNEIGVSDHFRNRRRNEQQVEQGVQANNQEATQATSSTTLTEAATTAQADTADAALAADLQEEEQGEVHAESSTAPMRTRSRRAAAAASSVIAVSAVAKKGGKKKAKKGKHSDGDSDFCGSDSNEDEINQRGGLNRSSARKGGRMKECEICGKRFLLRGEQTPDRFLCAMCRRSVDKTFKEQAEVAKRARTTTAPKAAKRRRTKKTEGGLLEYDPGLPTLQDLCVRAIAKHLDQVDSFGDISTQSLHKLCRIICKMRLLDEQTLRLFLGPEKTSVTLYDCTKITDSGMQRLIEQCPNVTSLDLEYCGRMSSQNLLDMARNLTQLKYVRLDGAFVVSDKAWAMFFRTMGERLQSFKIKYTGFGPGAMRALVTHCTALHELQVSECIDFDDSCLAMLAAPITDHEEVQQELERAIKLLSVRSKKGKMAAGGYDDADGYMLAEDAARSVASCDIPSWQPLSKLERLNLSRPYKPMSNQTAMRVVETLGSQLCVLDFAGFKDIEDDFLLQALDKNCGRLQELHLSECNSISSDAFAEFFARQRHKRATSAGHAADGKRSNGLTRVGLDKCYMLTDLVIQELVLYSGATLRWLNLNSVDDNLTMHGLLALAGKIYRPPPEQDGHRGGPELVDETSGCVLLEEIDLSWVHCASDTVLDMVLSKCTKLAQIKTYGCSDVTAFAPTRPGLVYIGRECDTL
ncbi:UV-damaged DNA-binding protein rad7 [Coemansia spiralis]|uniref:UV-damaged DNA-binding protein rad7 n=2 Tax=Coemansia TaxID=4863 RepID=A0A9W8GBQ2_9FUNG|nr:UV-damaged DNA-binding protein rad7 [Coemansia umbellata]KAJ2621613.1 UV-damaged DNA-binding protein rad7 [Coemansia sp. RSA 1358]KAJ2680140.1 UV-damaged DNA-binding protein rad7 [Coemansia spiralis]